MRLKNDACGFFEVMIILKTTKKRRKMKVSYMHPGLIFKAKAARIRKYVVEMNVLIVFQLFY